MGSQQCIHWCRAGNAGQVAAPEIGSGWNEVGAVTYVPSFHGGGADCDANGEELFQANFTDGLNKNYGCIEFWIQPHFASADPISYGLFLFGQLAPGLLHFDCFFNQANNSYTMRLRPNANGTQVRTTNAWNANDLFHIAFIWDKDNGLGGKRGAIYVDGVDVSVTHAGHNADWSANNFPVPNPFSINSGLPLGTLSNAVMGNLKIWNFAKTDFSDRWIEGFGGAKPRMYLIPPAPPLPPQVQVIEPLSCERANPQVLYMGQDLYDLGYVKSIFRVKEFKTFLRDKVIQNEYSVICKNHDNNFSVDNPASMLSGTDWRYETLQIIDEDGEEIWNGIVEDITANHRNKTATIITKNSLVEVMNTVIEYESAAYETAAQAAQNILDAYSYTDYNAASFITSDSVLAAGSCLVWVKVSLKDNVTLQQIFEKLSEFGGADGFSHRGVLYYKTWQPFTGGVKINLVESDLRAAPIVSSMVNVMVNDYQIGYANTEAVITDATGGNIGSISRSKYGTHSLPPVGGSSNEQIVLQSAAAAQFLGEIHIRRTHYKLDDPKCRPLRAIETSLPLSHREWIDLTSFYRLDWIDEAWSGKLFEVAYFERDPNVDTIKMTSWEVDE